MCITLNISQNLWNYVLNYITNCSSYSIDFIWNVRLYRVDGSICSRKYKTINYSLFFRLGSHGTGKIRDCTQIRPLTAVHTKPDKLQAKKCSHGAGRICARNYLLNFVVCYLQFFHEETSFVQKICIVAKLMQGLLILSSAVFCPSISSGCLLSFSGFFAGSQLKCII